MKSKNIYYKIKLFSEISNSCSYFKELYLQVLINIKMIKYLSFYQATI